MLHLHVSFMHNYTIRFPKLQRDLVLTRSLSTLCIIYTLKHCNFFLIGPPCQTWRWPYRKKAETCSLSVDIYKIKCCVRPNYLISLIFIIIFSHTTGMNHLKKEKNSASGMFSLCVSVFFQFKTRQRKHYSFLWQWQ